MLTLLLLIIPFIASLINLKLSSRGAFLTTIFSAIASLGLTLFIASQLEPSATFQFAMQYDWVPALASNFSIGIDGVALVFLLLTYIGLTLILLAYHNQYQNLSPLVYACVAFFQFAITGVFVSLDALLYYVFWELSLLPIFAILILLNGNGNWRTFFKFFLFTVGGSLFMLLSIITIRSQTNSFDITDFSNVNLNVSLQAMALIGFALAYFIKIPVFPFHTWQPDTYTKAPYIGTMLLSGIMLKMAVFSILRWVIPVFDITYFTSQHWMLCLSCVGVVYAAVIAITQTDFKRMLAFSSMSHVGMIAAGLFCGDAAGMQGAVLQSFNHAIIAIGLFYIAMILEQRLKTTDMDSMGGLRTQVPKLASAFMIILLASVAMPLTNGFAGEVLLLKGIYTHSPSLAIFAGTSVIFSAVYMLRAYMKIMLGESKSNSIAILDLQKHEWLVIAPIIILIFLLGLYPQVLLQWSEPVIQALIN